MHSGLRSAPRRSHAGHLDDVADLIAADHQRIRRLLEALDDVVRYAERGGRGHVRTLAAVWARIAALLCSHADAEQEICFLAMFRHRPDWLPAMEEAAAELNDMRAAVAEARLQEAGGPAWWRAVNAARRSACDHIFAMEHGVLAGFRDRCAGPSRAELARQWRCYIAARQRDDDEMHTVLRH